MNHQFGPRLSARAGKGMRGKVHRVRYARWLAQGRAEWLEAHPPQALAEVVKPGRLAARIGVPYKRTVPMIPDVGRVQ